MAVGASTRCTTDVPTPTVRPILRIPIPSARSSRIRCSTDALTGPPAELGAALLSPRKAGVDPLSDHAAFELGEDAAHLEHRPTGWRAGVERLLVQIQMAA